MSSKPSKASKTGKGGIQKKTSAGQAGRATPRLETVESATKRIQKKYTAALKEQNKAFAKIAKDHEYELEQQRAVFEIQTNFLQEQINVLCENNEGMQQIVRQRVTEFAAKYVAKKLAEIKEGRVGKPAVLTMPCIEDVPDDVDDDHNRRREDDDDVDNLQEGPDNSDDDRQDNSDVEDTDLFA